MSEQRKTIKDSYDRFLTLLTHLPVPAAYIHDGVFVSINPEFQHFFAITDEQQMSSLSLLDLVSELDQEKVKIALNNIKHKQNSNGINLDNISVKTLRSTTLLASLLFSRSNMNSEECIQVIIQPQLTDNGARASKRLQHNQLLSPEDFIQHVAQAINANQESVKYSLCLLEIANYDQIKKHTSVTRRKQLMDEVYEIMALICQQHVLVTQLNSDIYSILVNDISHKKCVEHLKNLQSLLLNHCFVIDDTLIPVTTNMGAVHLMKNISSPEQAISLADIACTVSRSRNKNQLYIYTSNKVQSTIGPVDLECKKSL